MLPYVSVSVLVSKAFRGLSGSHVDPEVTGTPETRNRVRDSCTHTHIPGDVCKMRSEGEADEFQRVLLYLSVLLADFV